MPDDDRYLRTQDLRKMFNVSPKTIYAWVDDGFIEAIILPGGHRRYLRSSVEAFAKTLTDGEHHDQ